ncbi:hypothetical protein [Bacillus wiedmannii]|uniref:hypothetical protein n=1 Tax=Bacillus wiedmannii TaxID=1890302 RepID=UPI000BEF57F7|nr:hypothetical protein [Bacillus wiedmannii]PEL16469.1 hypothetical protein CN599_21055 [Bacillus wiedmannii]
MSKTLSNKELMQQMNKNPVDGGISKILGINNMFKTPSYAKGVTDVFQQMSKNPVDGAISKILGTNNLLKSALYTKGVTDVFQQMSKNPAEEGISKILGINNMFKTPSYAKGFTGVFQQMSKTPTGGEISKILGINNMFKTPSYAKSATGVFQQISKGYVGINMDELFGAYNPKKSGAYIQGLFSVDKAVKNKMIEALIDLKENTNDSTEKNRVFTDDERVEMEQTVVSVTTEFLEDVTENKMDILESLNKFGSKIIELAEGFKRNSPFFFIIFFYVFSPLYNFIAVPIAQDYMKNSIYYKWEYFRAPTPAQSAKNINNALSEECGHDLGMLNCIRVTNKNTPVYKGSKRSSGKVDEIKINQPVFIEKKRKKWSLVSYNNDQGEEITGWVLTSNLEKAKNK